MKSIYNLINRHNDLQQQCVDVQSELKDNYKEEIAAQMRSKDKSLAITSFDIDLVDKNNQNGRKIQVNDYYKSEFTDKQMRRIDDRVQNWVKMPK